MNSNECNNLNHGFETVIQSLSCLHVVSSVDVGNNAWERFSSSGYHEKSDSGSSFFDNNKILNLNNPRLKNIYSSLSTESLGGNLQESRPNRRSIPDLFKNDNISSPPKLSANSNTEVFLLHSSYKHLQAKKSMPKIPKLVLKNKRRHQILENENKVYIRNYIKQNSSSQKSLNNEVHLEKSTYCRPVMNLYNQEFIYKTMERNDRLQTLLQKLLIIRQKQKQKDNWNNYIIDLKYRHGHNDSEAQSRVLIKPRNDYSNKTFAGDQSKPCNHLLEDFYKAYDTIPVQRQVNPVDTEPERNPFENHPYCYPTSSAGRFILQEREQLRLQQEMLRNFPKTAHKERLRKIKIMECLRNTPKHIVGNDRRDQRCMTMAATKTKANNTEIPKTESKNMSGLEQGYLKNSFAQTTSISTIPFTESDETDKQKEKIKANNTEIPKTESKNILGIEQGHLKNSFAQTTSISTIPFTKSDETDKKKEKIKEEYQRVSNNVERLRRKVYEPKPPVDQNPLAKIETKLDSLITSINTFMQEVDTRRTVNCLKNNKSVTVNCDEFKNSDTNSENYIKSETFGLRHNEKRVCGIATNTSGSTFNVGHIVEKTSQPEDNLRSNVDKIISVFNEIDRDHDVTRDVDTDSMIEQRQCSVQLSVTGPTTEMSTEVTASLARAGKSEPVTIEENHEPMYIKPNPIPKRRAITSIAINTDPLSVLSLIRISTETLKQLLTYMSSIDYQWYLSMLQPNLVQTVNLQQTRPGNVETQYSCNICGKSFDNPSRLNSHIREHNLGKARDCCVCRHMLEMQQKRPPGAFACQHCGQRFTRAYCCELHEQTCASNRDRCHDEASDLILLS